MKKCPPAGTCTKFELGTLLPKTRILECRTLERKRKPNAKVSVLGMLRLRILSRKCYTPLHGAGEG